MSSPPLVANSQAIREVIDRGNALSPLTREELAREVYQNFQLRAQIAAWQESNEPAMTSVFTFFRSKLILGAVVAVLVALVLLQLVVTLGAHNMGCPTPA